MNLFAAAGYALKHQEDFAKLAALMPKGTSDPSLAADVIALINKHFPGYNPNHLIEDTVELIRQEMA